MMMLAMVREADNAAKRAEPAHVIGGEIVNDTGQEKKQGRAQATPGADLDFDAGALPVGRESHPALGLPGHGSV